MTAATHEQIQVGQKFPNIAFTTYTNFKGPEDQTGERVRTNTHDALHDKTFIVLLVPGAFTGTCSKQLPTYAEKANEANIAVIGPNTCDVMSAWQAASGDTARNITMIGDVELEIIRECGLTLDRPKERGLGPVVAQRAALILVQGVVKEIFVDKDPAKIEETDIDKVLAAYNKYV